jgi:nitroreductase
MDAITALKTRRSIRSYQNREVSREILKDIVDCARLAPSGMNHKQWEFVVVTDPQIRKKLALAVQQQTQIATVPACILVLVKEHPFYVEDGSAATMAILYAARAHGLGSCWISSDKQPWANGLRDIVGAPPQYKAVTLIPIGYPAEEPRPEKRSIESVLHWDKFRQG